MHASITIPDELQTQIEALAQAEGKTVDELTAEVLQRHLDRRSLERFRRQAESRRQGMSDEQVQAIVEQAIAELRHG